MISRSWLNSEEWQIHPVSKNEPQTVQVIPLINSLNLQIISYLILFDRNLAELVYFDHNDSNVQLNNYLQTTSIYKHDCGYCQLITVIQSYEKNKVVQNKLQRHCRKVIYASIEIEVLSKSKKLYHFMILQVLHWTVILL